MSDSFAEKVMDGFYEFIHTSDWHEGKKVVQSHPELLQPLASQFLALTLAQSEIWFKGHVSHQDAERYVRLHLGVLEACREKGVQSTFSDLT